MHPGILYPDIYLVCPGLFGMVLRKVMYQEMWCTGYTWIIPEVVFKVG